MFCSTLALISLRLVMYLLEITWSVYVNEMFLITLDQVTRTSTNRGGTNPLLTQNNWAGPN